MWVKLMSEWSLMSINKDFNLMLKNTRDTAGKKHVIAPVIFQKGYFSCFFHACVYKTSFFPNVHKFASVSRYIINTFIDVQVQKTSQNV